MLLDANGVELTRYGALLDWCNVCVCYFFLNLHICLRISILFTGDVKCVLGSIDLDLSGWKIVAAVCAGVLRTNDHLTVIHALIAIAFWVVGTSPPTITGNGN